MALVTIGRAGGVGALFEEFTGGFFVNAYANTIEYESGGVRIKLEGSFTVFGGPSIANGWFWKMSTYPEPADGAQTTWQGLLSWELYNASREAALLDAMSGDDIVNVQSLATDIDALLEGFGGNDILDATEGQDDTLDGGKGDDTLFGADGADRMTGGSGEDVFDFNLASDTGTTGDTRDRIEDFKRGVDLIDLTDIDAKSGGGANDAFKFIGKDGFHDKQGELRIKKSGDDVLLQGDIDGNGSADFAILVADLSKLSADDLLL